MLKKYPSLLVRVGEVKEEQLFNVAPFKSRKKIKKLILNQTLLNIMEDFVKIVRI